MYKVVLNSVQFFDVIYDSPTRFRYKVLCKSISTNRHTDTNETFRKRRGERLGLSDEVSQRGGACMTVKDLTRTPEKMK